MVGVLGSGLCFAIRSKYKRYHVRRPTTQQPQPQLFHPLILLFCRRLAFCTPFNLIWKIVFLWLLRYSKNLRIHLLPSCWRVQCASESDSNFEWVLISDLSGGSTHAVSGLIAQPAIYRLWPFCGDGAIIGMGGHWTPHCSLNHATLLLNVGCCDAFCAVLFCPFCLVGYMLQFLLVT